ncbi:MAG: metallophosphoesterase [Nitrospirae bacterium]|nr:metallophosphoesterase [Nitrospirota bacterium]
MKLFLAIYFLIYGSMHYYVLRSISLSVHLNPIAKAAVVLFMLIMINSPMLVRYAEKHGYEQTAIAMSYVGYIWMGFILIFVSTLLFTDLYRLGVNVFVPAASEQVRRVFLPLTAALIISTYSYFEALNVTAEHLVIKHPKIPKEAGVIKIAQVSDVHLGLIVRQDRLKRIFDIVSRERPDVLVSTGDLVDSQTDNLDVLAANIGSIPTRYGKFACLGNHEYYAGISQSLKITQEAGFTILRGQVVTVGGFLNIAGVSDFPVGDKSTERELLTSLSRQNYTVLLKHRPIVDKDSIGRFELQLSGHTHKGQIFPFSILTWLYYPIHAGLLNLKDNTYLYVSKGSGTWGPPMRFLSQPEVTIIELQHGK